MISCTEFIPAYSELFAYLEDKGGHEEVRRFWKYLFEPDGKGIPLVNFIEKEGIRGCFSYWKGTLSEEAADFTMYLNENAGWFMMDMRSCPSKGRLLKLKNETGYAPYGKYCLHCDYYRMAAEKAGLRYIYDFRNTDNASCNLLIYDPAKFDGRVIVDGGTEIIERRASQNEYFHKDFHSSMNMGIDYVGGHYGLKGVGEYFDRYVLNVLHNDTDKIKTGGLSAAREMILEAYLKEKAEDAAEARLKDGVLDVRIKYSPAVKHLQETGRTVSEWFRYTTEALMERVAFHSGLEFEMDSYDEATGAAHYILREVK